MISDGACGCRHRRIVLHGTAVPGDLVAFAASRPPGTAESTSLVHVHRVGDERTVLVSSR
jgi:hypothetical protein